MSDADGAPGALLEAAAERLTERVRERLVERSAGGRRPADAQRELPELVRAVIAEEAAVLGEAERERLAARVLQGTVGLGPLEPLMADPEVDEVMVNGPGCVYVERHGRIERTEVKFGSEEEVLHVVERILAPLGRRVDEASPLVDARLPDGSRVNCVIPPLSLAGPVLTVRKFRRQGFSHEELVANGTLTPALRDFLAAAVRDRANLVVCGGTGSGKTTTLNALSAFVPPDERIVTIEDAAELRLQQPHVLRLEARPANVEGRGEVSIRALVRNALRMRPDRIVVGEVRGGEAIDMLTAMSTGHEGSLTTLHANSPEDAVRRIETMALMADVDLPHAAVQQQVASAIDLIVHQERGRDGRRRVSAVAEVVRTAGGVGVREVYALERERGFEIPVERP